MMHRRTGKRFAASLTILGWLLLVASVAEAAHPLISDDAGNIGKGGVQIEITAEIADDRERQDDGSTGRQRSGEAAVSVGYGLAETVDLVVTLPFRSLSSERNDQRIGRESGLADADLDLKWRFLEREGWGLALKPGISLPTGRPPGGLGSGRTAWRLFGIATRQTGPAAFHLNLGHVRNENNRGDRRDLWHASAAAELEPFRKLKFVANVGIETNPVPGSSVHPAFALGGVIYRFSEKVSLDGGIKFGLTRPETDLSGLFGVTLAF